MPDALLPWAVRRQTPACHHEHPARHWLATPGFAPMLVSPDIAQMDDRLGICDCSLRGVIPADAGVPPRCISLSAEKGPCSELGAPVGVRLVRDGVETGQKLLRWVHSNCENLLLRSHRASGGAQRLPRVALQGTGGRASVACRHSVPFNYRPRSLVEPMPSSRLELGRENAYIVADQRGLAARRATRDAGHDAPVRPFA